jgi:hypothetical protein
LDDSIDGNDRSRESTDGFVGFVRAPGLDRKSPFAPIHSLVHFSATGRRRRTATNDAWGVDVGVDVGVDIDVVVFVWSRTGASVGRSEGARRRRRWTDDDAAVDADGAAGSA